MLSVHNPFFPVPTLLRPCTCDPPLTFSLREWNMVVQMVSSETGRCSESKPSQLSNTCMQLSNACQHINVTSCLWSCDKRQACVESVTDLYEPRPLGRAQLQHRTATWRAPCSKSRPTEPLPRVDQCFYSDIKITSSGLGRWLSRHLTYTILRP